MTESDSSVDEYNENETEIYIDGYTDALQDIADGCFELMAEVKDESEVSDGDCPICGSDNLIQELGTPGEICADCDTHIPPEGESIEEII